MKHDLAKHRVFRAPVQALWLALLVGGIILGLCGCPDSGEMQDRVWVLPAPQSISDTHVLLNPNEAAGLQPGDILVSQAAGGLLRRATACQVSGERLEVETAPAALSEAVKNGGLAKRITFSTDDFIDAGLQPFGDGYCLAERNEVELLRNYGLLVTLDHAALLLNPALDFVLDFKEGKIATFLFHVSGRVDFELQLRIELDESQSFDLEESLFPPLEHAFAEMIGPIPVLGKVALSVPLGLSGHFLGATYTTFGLRVSSGYSYTLRFEEGRWYEEDAFLPVGFEWLPLSGQIEAGWELESACTIQLDFSLYNSLGLGLGITPYNRLQYRCIPAPHFLRIDGACRFFRHAELGLFDERFCVRESGWQSPEKPVFYWDEVEGKNCSPSQTKAGSP